MAKKKEATSKDFLVDFNVPHYLESRFATNFVVQRMADLFKISMFEIKPEFILSKEDRKAFENKDTIRADCLATYIVSPEALEKFAGILNDQVQKYKDSKTIES